MTKITIDSKKKFGKIELEGNKEEILADFGCIVFSIMGSFLANDIPFDVAEDLMSAAFEAGKKEAAEL